MNAVFAGMMGLAWGSFLNVCIHRLPRDESLIHPSSSCPRCGRKLDVLDLLPVIGYLILGGRCRDCRSRVSIRYPLVELWTAVFCVGIWLWAPNNWVLVKYLLFFSLLTVLFFIDLDTMLLPNILTIPGAAAGLVWIGLSAAVGLELDVGHKSALIGGAVGFGVFAAVRELGSRAFGREAMGGGDVKLMLMIGLHLGWERLLVGMMCAFLLGFVVAAHVLVMRGVRTVGREIPFGPMLAAGGAVAAFWGDRLWQWYLRYTL